MVALSIQGGVEAGRHRVTSELLPSWGSLLAPCRTYCYVYRCRLPCYYPKILNFPAIISQSAPDELLVVSGWEEILSTDMRLQQIKLIVRDYLGEPALCANNKEGGSCENQLEMFPIVSYLDISQMRPLFLG